MGSTPTPGTIFFFVFNRLLDEQHPYAPKQVQEQYGFDEQENKTNTSESLQLRVLRLGLLKDGDVGVGVFPEGEEVLVGNS